MNIQQNISLKPYNTFGINVRTKYFLAFESVNQLDNLYRNKNFESTKKMILGGGSNMLLVNDFDGIMLKNNLKGISITAENEDFAFIEVQGGENWHQFVLWCLQHDYGGIENLSLIPGTVGAAPIQNIGAYGIELKDAFHKLTAYDNFTKSVETHFLKRILKVGISKHL